MFSETASPGRGVFAINTDFLKRREGESRFEHHKRLLTAKLVTKTLDADYATLSSYLYGQDYAPDVARRMAYGSMKTLALAENEGMFNTGGMAEDIERQLAEVRVEKQKIADYRNDITRAVRERARMEEVEELIRNAIEKSDLPELCYEPAVEEAADNDLIITLNDIHYGAVVRNAWHSFDSDECRLMFARYLDRIEEIRKTHRSDSCTVVCAGDCISGNIHYNISVTNKENVIEQVIGVSELIAEFLHTLSGKFRRVNFVSVSGNHSRLNPNKDQTLTSERLDDLVSWYLEARLQNHENIAVCRECRIDPTMAAFYVRGKLYCCVHGDYDGSNEKIQSIRGMIGDDLYAVISGHLHHNATDTVQGVKTVMAGSFLGMDDYCIRKRIISEPEQSVCVCTDNGILCTYPVPLG